MKGLRIFVIGSLLGAVLGWIAGYLRFPFIGMNYAFWVGVLASLAGVVFLVALLFVWNKNRMLLRIIGNNPEPKLINTNSRIHTVVWILVSLFIVVGGMISGIMIYKQNELFVRQSERQNAKIQEQSEVLESLRKSNLVFLMGNVLDQVDAELKGGEGQLTEATIARIAALSYSFEPYSFIDGDSLSEQKLSPERGQLLLALSLMELDSSNFAAVKQKASFAGVDLKHADLRGADLSGADLRGADFRGADLRKADLSGADLTFARMEEARLDSADLHMVGLRRAKLNWVSLNGADLLGARFPGADLSNAQLRNARLEEVFAQWAKFDQALLQGAKLVHADLEGSTFTQANLKGADLTEANLMKAQLEQAIFTETQIKGLTIKDGWMEKLEKWKVVGKESILQQYQIAEDTSGRYHNGKLSLQPK